MAQPSTQPPSREASQSANFTQDSYNHGGLITFILAMGFSVLFFIILLLAHPGVDLQEALPNGGKTEAQTGEAPAANPEAGPPSPSTDDKAQ